MVPKLLHLDQSLCSWIHDFLTNCPQKCRYRSHLSSTLLFKIDVLQGSVLSTILYALYTCDYVPTHITNTLLIWMPKW